MNRELSEVEIVRSKYESEVKPAMENGEYELAAITLASALYIIRGREQKIMATVHMGWSFLASASLLEKKLREGNPERIKRAQSFYEAYAAQTTLPL